MPWVVIKALVVGGITTGGMHMIDPLHLRRLIDIHQVATDLILRRTINIHQVVTDIKISMAIMKTPQLITDSSRLEMHTIHTMIHNGEQAVGTMIGLVPRTIDIIRDTKMNVTMNHREDEGARHIKWYEKKIDSYQNSSIFF